MIDSQQTDVDYLVLGDWAEVINGKLYLMGGGWTRFAPPGYPAPMNFGLAIGVRVPYPDTSVPHHLTLVLESADGAELMRLESDFDTGRPPGTQGESQLMAMALSGSAQLGAPGDFVFIASVDGAERRRLSFKAIDRR